MPSSTCQDMPDSAAAHAVVRGQLRAAPLPGSVGRSYGLDCRGSQPGLWLALATQHLLGSTSCPVLPTGLQALPLNGIEGVAIPVANKQMVGAHAPLNVAVMQDEQARRYGYTVRDLPGTVVGGDSSPSGTDAKNTVAVRADSSSPQPAAAICVALDVTPKARLGVSADPTRIHAASATAYRRASNQPKRLGVEGATTVTTGGVRRWHGR
jgi:hypothetical protein